MKYDILRKEKDITGKIRVWIDLGNGEAQIFKFNKEISKTEAKKLVDDFLASRIITKEKELEEINRKIDELNKIKTELEKEIWQ